MEGEADEKDEPEDLVTLQAPQIITLIDVHFSRYFYLF